MGRPRPARGGARRGCSGADPLEDGPEADDGDSLGASRDDAGSAREERDGSPTTLDDASLGEDASDDASSDGDDGGAEDGGHDATTWPDAEPHDAGDDAATSSDAGDSGPPPAMSFAMPAILKDEWTCWQDQFPNPVCKLVPSTTPPIFETKCADEGIYMVKVRIPPRSCVRLDGRFDSSRLSADTCFTRTSCTAQGNICRIRRNDTDEEQFAHLHDTSCLTRRLLGEVRWYAIENCPAPTASCF